MPKIIFWVLSLFLLVGRTEAQLQWVSRTSTHEVAMGRASVEGRFTCSNRGEREIRILKVMPSCDCTTVNTRNTLIAAGQTAAIDWKLDLGDIQGSVEKQILITTDEPDHPETLLTIIVHTPVVVATSAQRLGWPKGSAGETQFVTLSLPLGGRITNVRASVLRKGFSAVVRQDTGTAEYAVGFKPIETTGMLQDRGLVAITVVIAGIERTVRLSVPLDYGRLPGT